MLLIRDLKPYEKRRKNNLNTLDLNDLNMYI